MEQSKRNRPENIHCSEGDCCAWAASISDYCYSSWIRGACIMLHYLSRNKTLY